MMKHSFPFSSDVSVALASANHFPSAPNTHIITPSSTIIKPETVGILVHYYTNVFHDVLVTGR